MRRIGRNEALFREINEAIEQGLWPGEQRKLIRFRCECARLDCQRVIQLPLADYEAVRANPRRFVLEPGHEIPEVDIVVDRCDGFVVVEKVGAAGRTAEAEDPRDES
jgi:hypothetical protein